MFFCAMQKTEIQNTAASSNTYVVKINRKESSVLYV